MIKDKKGDKARLYRGYYKPAGLAAKDKKIDGWHNETADEFPATFNTTYNDTADVVVKGKTEQKSEWVHKQGLTSQDSTIETITNPLSTYLIPFRCGSGTFDMSISDATNAKWLYNGTMYEVSRLQLTTVADEVVWLLTDGFGGSVIVSNNFVAQPIKLDLADLQGKITYYLDLYNCPNITGSLADLQGKITYYLRLSYCSNITGSLADLQGKITYYLDLYNCSNITGVYTPVGAGVPTITNLSYTGLSASDMDATLIAYANASKDNGTFTATGMTRTAASDTAVATLTGRGWTISGITKV